VGRERSKKVYTGGGARVREKIDKEGIADRRSYVEMVAMVVEKRGKADKGG
jgi:hypothetical protein